MVGPHRINNVHYAQTVVNEECAQRTGISRHLPRVGKDPESVKREQGRRLVRAREHKGLSSAAEAASYLRHKTPTTYQHHENGTRGISRAVKEYAEAFDVREEWLLYGRNPPDWATSASDEASDHGANGGESSQGRMTVGAPQTEVRKVPVLGIVQAGAWAEVVDADPHPTEWVVFDEPEYARTEAFALIVRGPSVDQVYPDGTRVICIPASSTGIQEGDFVIVRRRRGVFAETTLKQIQVGADGEVELWPRSSDPAFQEPIRISETRDPEESPEILAVVVARYDVGRAGRGPFIQFK